MPAEIAVEVPEAVAEQVIKAAKEKEILIQRYAAEQMSKFLADVRPKLRDIKGFWRQTLLNRPHFAAATASDREALSHLVDIELVQDVKDPREYEIVFHFDENPFFTNKTLSKKYSLPEDSQAAPADGSINQDMRDFEPENLVAEATKIDWKDGKDLCAAHPRKIPTEDDLDEGAFDGDIGSFFHYFTSEGDLLDAGEQLLDILSDPLAAFDGDDDDEEDELDDEDDDEEGSIDLEDDEDEKPAKKKQRV